MYGLAVNVLVPQIFSVVVVVVRFVFEPILIKMQTTHNSTQRQWQTERSRQRRKMQRLLLNVKPKPAFSVCRFNFIRADSVWTRPMADSSLEIPSHELAPVAAQRTHMHAKYINIVKLIQTMLSRHGVKVKHGMTMACEFQYVNGECNKYFSVALD